MYVYFWFKCRRCGFSTKRNGVNVTGLCPSCLSEFRADTMVIELPVSEMESKKGEIIHEIFCETCGGIGGICVCELKVR